MHLTNFSINFESENFEDTDDGSTGSKRSLRSILANDVEDGEKVWLEIAACVRKTLMSIHPKLQDNYDRHFGNRRAGAAEREESQQSACFELLGFDFMLDETLKLFLLEVNSAPSLATPTVFDEEMKEPLLTEAFKIIGLKPGARRRYQKLRERQQQERHTEHVSRLKEVTKMREERKKTQMGFGSLEAPMTLAPPADPASSSSRETGKPVQRLVLRSKSVPVKTRSGVLDETGESSEPEGEEEESVEDEETEVEDEDDIEEKEESDKEEQIESEFAFLGPPVSENYVQILPLADKTGLDSKIAEAATSLAKGWNVGAEKRFSASSIGQDMAPIKRAMARLPLARPKSFEGVTSTGPGLRRPSTGATKMVAQPLTERTHAQEAGHAEPGRASLAQPLPSLKPQAPRPPRELLPLKTVQISMG